MTARPATMTARPAEHLAKWTCERQDHESGDIYWAIHARKDYEFIANVYNKHAASLIAVAPDLLDKLREMTLLFKSALLMSTPEIAKEGMTFARAAEAIIAKATGAP